MRSHFAAFRSFAGTRRNTEEVGRCSGVEVAETPALQGLQDFGTPGTPGTPQNDEAGRETGPVPHVPQGGAMMGYTHDAAETLVAQGFQDDVPRVPHVPQPNDEAETLPAEVASPAWRTFSPPPCRLPPIREHSDWRTRVRVDGPGVRIVPPSIELPWAEYDRIADALIAAAGEGTAEAGRLRRAKSKGAVMDDGDRSVFTMGRG